jgi:hypothetical protein
VEVQFKPFFKPSETEIIESSDDDWDSNVYDNLKFYKLIFF